MPVTRRLAPLLPVLLLAVVGCGKTKSSSGGPPPPPSTPPPPPSFDEVNAILTAKCAACHADASHTQPHFIGHQDVLRANAAQVSDAITTSDPKKAMPRQRNTTPLTDAEKQTMLVFLGKQPLAAGATAPVFATDVAPITVAKCTPCHGDQSHLQPHFVGHEDVFRANGETVAEVITSTDPYAVMPPPAVHGILSQDERSKILAYLAVTAP